MTPISPLAGLAAAATHAAEWSALHLAIGMFDGVHRGHRAVIDTARCAAADDDAQVLALTFDPHPSRLLRPEQPVRLIQSLEQRVAALMAAGVDGVVVEPFVPAFAAIEADDFLPHVRRALPNLRALHVGENWRFGRGRRGDIHQLRTAGAAAGIAVISAARLRQGEDAISSTRIRECLVAGQLAEANAMLGRPYDSTGRVETGKQLGRKLGVPTLNLPWTPDCTPRYGVYAVRVRGADEPPGAGKPAVANFGLRPTVESTDAPRLEVHVLGECPWQTDDLLTVEWCAFLRPEQRFAGLDELRAAITADKTAAKHHFGG